jgi:hypothetical protein
MTHPSGTGTCSADLQVGSFWPFQTYIHDGNQQSTMFARRKISPVGAKQSSPGRKPWVHGPPNTFLQLFFLSPVGAVQPLNFPANDMIRAGNSEAIA